MMKLLGTLPGEIGDRVREFHAMTGTGFAGKDQRMRAMMDRDAAPMGPLQQMAEAHLIAKAVQQGSSVEAAVLAITGGDGAGQLQLASEQEVHQYEGIVARKKHALDVDRALFHEQKDLFDEFKDFAREQNEFTRDNKKAKRNIDEEDLQCKREMEEADARARSDAAERAMQAKREMEFFEHRRVIRDTEASYWQQQNEAIQQEWLVKMREKNGNGQAKRYDTTKAYKNNETKIQKLRNEIADINEQIRRLVF